MISVIDDTVDVPLPITSDVLLAVPAPVDSEVEVVLVPVPAVPVTRVVWVPLPVTCVVNGIVEVSMPVTPVPVVVVAVSPVSITPELVN